MLTAPQEAAPYPHRKYSARRSSAMPSVIDVPAIVERQEHDCHEAQPQARAVHLGFWHTMVEYLRRCRTYRMQRILSSSFHGPLHRLETPADLLAREYPTLYLRTFTGV